MAIYIYKPDKTWYKQVFFMVCPKCDSEYYLTLAITFDNDKIVRCQNCQKQYTIKSDEDLQLQIGEDCL